MVDQNKEKGVFLSATYEDQIDCIEEIKSMLAELNVKVHHFKGGDFQNGRADINPDDRCIEKIAQVPNYMLIVSYRAGSDYGGANTDYKGLTVTHAEFRVAHDDYNRKKPDKKLFCFVRKKVADSYDIWKKQPNPKNPADWPAAEKVYQLLEDLENKKIWREPFEHSLQLKDLIKNIMHHFI